MAKPVIQLTRRAALGAGLALLGSGCFGGFGATHSLYKWNTDVSDNKWLRWLVFLVLIIVPVYGLFILADALVLNTIEFFSGKNPINGGTAQLGGGHTLTSSRTTDPNVIRHEHRKDGKLVRVLYVKRVNDREMLLLDEHFHVLTGVELNAHGKVSLRDGTGRELAALGAAEIERIGLALEAGASPLNAVQAELGHGLALAQVER
jgi:hypothetical protein